MNLKSKIDTVVPKAINKAGYILNPLLLKIFKEEGQLLIFYFHGLYRNLEDRKLNHVDPQNNITVDQFSDFIEYFIRNKYQFIGPEDLEKGLEKDKSYIMITFDDGYYNNLYSLPVLEEFQVPATYFITTKNLISNTSYWWDVVYKYRTQKGVPLEQVQKEQEYLKRFKHSEIDKYLLDNFGNSCFNPWGDLDRPMSTEELKIFASHNLVTIGNHTHNHSILTNYTLKEVTLELKRSNDILTKIIGYCPNAMAFPNGNYTSSLLELSNDAGFKYVFTTDSYINRLPLKNTDIITLNRFMTRTIPICNYGSFTRLGYDGNKLYNNLKKKIINFID